MRKKLKNSWQEYTLGIFLALSTLLLIGSVTAAYFSGLKPAGVTVGSGLVTSSTWAGIAAISEDNPGAESNNNPPGVLASTDDTYRVLKLTASENESDRAPTSAELQNQAKHFNVIINSYNPSNPARVTYNVPQMHNWAISAGNTNGGDLKILQYLNGTHHYSCSTSVSAGIAAYSAKGNLLRHKGWNTWLLDIVKPSVRAYQINRGHQELAKSKYEGIWLDELGEYSYSASGNEPIKPDTCASNVIDTTDTNPKPAGPNGTYTLEEWYQGGAQLIRDAKAAYNNTGFNAGPNINSATLWSAGPGVMGMHEGWLLKVSSGKIPYPSVTAWKNSLDELVTAAQAGNYLQAYTEAQTSTEPAAIVNAAHKFALGTFLLGTDGKQYFHFRDTKGPVYFHPYWERLLIGRPNTAIAGYKTSGALYYRDFTQGKVIVNPTSTSQSMALSGSFKDIDNQVRTITGSITIAAHTAEILLNYTPPPPPETDDGNPPDPTPPPVSDGTDSGQQPGTDEDNQASLVKAPATAANTVVAGTLTPAQVVKVEENDVVKLSGVPIRPYETVDTTYLPNGEHCVAVERAGQKVDEGCFLVKNKLNPYQSLRNYFFRLLNGNKLLMEVVTLNILSIPSGFMAAGLYIKKLELMSLVGQITHHLPHIWPR